MIDYLTITDMLLIGLSSAAMAAVTVAMLIFMAVNGWELFKMLSK